MGPIFLPTTLHSTLLSSSLFAIYGFESFTGVTHLRLKPPMVSQCLVFRVPGSGMVAALTTMSQFAESFKV
jgi:hypothetical protein